MSGTAPATPPVAVEPRTVPAASRTLFDAQVEQARQFVDTAMAAGINVPVPTDPGGGPTHEQHKLNYRAIYDAGQLYRLTRDVRYREFSRAMLLAYADLYPGLGPHPARANQHHGRLFWQVLNDSVWVVNAVQGYEQIRSDLAPQDRDRIDTLFRQMAHFLSVDSVRTFDRIHNHASWATAAVGMTGYLLGDQDMVERALNGSRRDGSSGFLRQIDELLSPDGYYAEGPYYQRYSLWPLMVFANAIQNNDPSVRIFERRDAVLLQTVHSAVDLTYRGHFLPLNNALREKSLNTEEMYQGIAIAYAHSRDPELLDIARMQGRVALSAEGGLVAEDLAIGRASPFRFRSRLLRDGADGRSGAVTLMRTGDSETGQLLVLKNGSQGMGHGHFDRLNWLYYDRGDVIVTDYGSARFHNVAAKEGGRYLPENESWSKQSIAHNVLVVDGRSHFGGDLATAEAGPGEHLHFSDTPEFTISIGRSDSAYPGIAMTRALALVDVPGLEERVVVDLLAVQSDSDHRYDLPLHFNGHVIDMGPAFSVNTAARPVLGDGHGYQHIWVDAQATVQERPFLTWQTGNRFHSWHWVPQAGSSVILGESGANDPNFNLRREPMLIQRVERGRNLLFAGVLESHGYYDPDTERVDQSTSRIAAIRTVRFADADLAVVATSAGVRVAIAIARDMSPSARHRLEFEGQTIAWTGPAARIILP